MGDEGNVITVDFGKRDDDEALDESDYELECRRIREQNRGYLELFERSLVDAGLKQKTIDKHLDNVDFYLNEYLLYYDTHEMPFGCLDIEGFLGDFFIRKCMWSTPTSIKTNATSIKKFYKCMLDNGLVSAADYDELVGTIKERMRDWQADCAQFNDPGLDNPFLSDYGLPFGAGLGYGADSDSAFDPMAELDAIFRDTLKEMIGERLGEMSDEQLSALLESAKAGGLVEGPSLDGEDDDFGKVDAPTREDVITVFTLVLFYLTSWDERIGGKGGPVVHKAWKSADWDALDALRESDLVRCTNKAKSVTITQAGMSEAEEFLRASGFGHLVDSAR